MNKTILNKIFPVLVSVTILVLFSFSFFYITHNNKQITSILDETIYNSDINKSSNRGVGSENTNDNSSEGSNSTEDTDSSIKFGISKSKTSAIPSLETKTFTTADGETYPLRTYRTMTVNDPFGVQWWTSGSGLNTAWAIGAGSTQTTIAVIDTGFSLGHEEFTNRWAKNPGELGPTTVEAPSKLNCTDRFLPLDKSCNLIDDGYDGIVDNFTTDPYESGPTLFENPSQLNCTDQGLPLDKSCNMIDDDGNGYVDDVTGWDFANFDSSVQAGQTNPDGDGTSHGTEVVGVLAANGNNSKGIAGVNWSAKILPIQAIDDNSYGDTLTVSRAIYYAADMGVDIISISLGTDKEDSFSRKAIQYAIDKNIVVIAASGNDGCNCISYPARYPEVLSVGSYNSTMSASSFSNYGNELNILAPGEDMKTTTWIKNNQTSAYDLTGVSGTSFSTPYVAGLLGLARSHQPDATWGELIATLASTADHTGLTFTNPTSIKTGSGYANAGNLVSRVTTPSNTHMKYTFWPLKTNGTLGSNRVFQCYLADDFPSTVFYEINGPTSTYYTTDALEMIRAVTRNDNVRNLGRVCLGLPNDTASTLRSINLLSEIKNIQNFKQ